MSEAGRQARTLQAELQHAGDSAEREQLLRLKKELEALEALKGELRLPVRPSRSGITDDDGALLRLKAFIDGLKTVEKVEVLPYHTLGIAKYRALGMEYPLEGVRPPEKERVQNARMILCGGIGGK